MESPTVETRTIEIRTIEEIEALMDEEAFKLLKPILEGADRGEFNFKSKNEVHFILYSEGNLLRSGYYYHGRVYHISPIIE